MIDTPSNPMRDQVYSLPDLIREQVWTLEERTRKVITTPEIFGTRHIILTGCGDSHIAGIAAETVFEELTGIHTQALNAMQASRFNRLRPSLPHNPLLIAVSNSGEVARVVEAAQHYTEARALTLAITGSPDSRLGQASQRCVELTIPPFASAPGVRSYIMSLLALYLIAIRMGEVRGSYHADEAMNLRRELAALADVLQQVCERVDQPMRELAAQWGELANFELLGSGADRASAAYGAAKLIEAAGVHALDQDIEEWFHLQYFVSGARNTGTFVVCADNSLALSRAIEIEPVLQTLERPYLVLTGDDSAAHFKRGLSVGAVFNPLFAPLVYSVPLALFAAYLSQHLGESYGRGAQSQWADCRDGMTTRNSKII